MLHNTYASEKLRELEEERLTRALVLKRGLTAPKGGPRSGKPIIGLKPNRLPDYRPKTEALLHVFRHVTVTQVILAEHPAEIVISPLHLLQTRVLELLGLEESIDNLEYLSRPLDEFDSS